MLRLSNCALLAAMATTAVVASFAQAASFTTGFQATLSSEQSAESSGEASYYHVSVNANNAGVGAFANAQVGNNNPDTDFVRIFDEDIQAWSFLGGTNNSVAGRVEESGGLISWATSDASFDGFGQGQLKFWDDTDPGADIAISSGLSAVDDGGGGGYRSFGGAVTTIDISGLASGTVYAFYGSFSATPTVSAVMRDTDGVAENFVITNAHLNGDAATRTEYYLAELDFVTDGVYDEIEYTWLANGLDYTGNGRGAGALLTGTAVPEPSSLALLGLGGLLIARRRRG